MTRGPWSEHELQILMQCYRILPTKRLSIVFGRTAPSIYFAADRCGLVRRRVPHGRELIALVRARNAEGWIDQEIADDWTATQPHQPIGRRMICTIRKSLGLASNRMSDRVRDQVRQRTSFQLERAGVRSLADLRTRRHQRFASDRGWPGSLRPREVQIVDLLYERGSMTRRQIASAIGLGGDNQRKLLSCKYGRGSYLANLMHTGLVVRSTHKTVKGVGKGRSVYTYSCDAWVHRGMDWSKRWTETVAET